MLLRTRCMMLASVVGLAVVGGVGCADPPLPVARTAKVQTGIVFNARATRLEGPRRVAWAVQEWSSP